MAKLYSLRTARSEPNGQVKKWLYNALDVIATRQVADVLLDRMDATTERTYNFELATQAPAIAMSRRGIKVNRVKLADALREAEAAVAEIEREIAALPEIVELWDGLEKETGACKLSTRKDGKHTWERGVPDSPERTCVSCGTSRFRRSPFNAGSPVQKQHLLYDLMRLPKQRGKDKNITADKEALGRLVGKAKGTGVRVIEALLEHADRAKQRGFLSFTPSPDWRYKSTFSIGTAWTGRWASHSDSFGYGGNAQNISERFRYIFEADPGYDLAYMDYKQGESNLVAHLSGDEGYITAHREGDVHTIVTKMVWPELPWDQDGKSDKWVAKNHYPPYDDRPGHDYRFQSKAIAHGSNLGLTAFGMSIQKRMPLKAAQDGQQRYFRAFPMIRLWQDDVAEKVRNQEPLVNPLGITVRLFGRPWDEHTRKQGLAFFPQGLLAHIINIAAWRVWRELDVENGGDLVMLAQIHDALLFQVPKGRTDLVQRAAALMRVPIDIADPRGVVRRTTIDVEAAVGQNWGHKSAANPDGITEIDV